MKRLLFSTIAAVLVSASAAAAADLPAPRSSPPPQTQGRYPTYPPMQDQQAPYYGGPQQFAGGYPQMGGVPMGGGPICPRQFAALPPPPPPPCFGGCGGGFVGGYGGVPWVGGPRFFGPGFGRFGGRGLGIRAGLGIY